MSEDGGNLGESTYELINSTDGESQDAISESIGSLDCPRGDDVQSLNGSSHDENTDEEDVDEDDHQSSASSIRYANQVLQSPSTQLNSTSLQFRRTPDASILPQPIEFLEADENTDRQVYVDKISVKHTVREFDEEETANIVKVFGLQKAPGRLAATIRQTMSPNYLSTQEPLRVMYTGTPAALKDIVYKLSSAIWASGSTDGDGSASHRNSEALYNIVPISSFGSASAPEIELMESSGYQIRVEHCTAAEEMMIDGGSFPKDSVYCITIDQNKIYKSLVSPRGSMIQPRWALPHIAIFFSTENDDEQTKQTRDAAWEFMSRHNVPSVFICNNQSFNKPPSGRWSDSIDQHAVHMCLESRDPERPIPPQRLPIDLTSFLNIDARQMNRNLTYLTGLSEPVDELQKEKEPLSSKSTPVSAHGTDEKVEETHIWNLNRHDLWAKAREFSQDNEHWLVPLAMSLLGGIFAMVAAALMAQGSVTQNQSSSVATSAVSAILPQVSTAVVPTSSTMSSRTSTMMSTVTSTKTVNIQRAEASASPLASALSFAGFLSDKASIAVPEPETKHSAVCSVERHSDNEILVRMPMNKKFSWFSKGAIDFKLYRGDVPVKLPKASLVDEGVILEIDKKDAYGAMNVSIFTTRKPRINETFEVNFGKGVVVDAFEAGICVLQGIAEKVVHTVDDATHLVDNTMAGVGQKIRVEAAAIAGHIEGASQAAQRAAGSAKDSLDPTHLTTAIKDAQWLAADYVATGKEDAELTVLKAQVASKLWWLKVQGKKDEYTDYEQKASNYMRARYDEIVFARANRCQGANGKSNSACRKRWANRDGRPCSHVGCPRRAAKAGSRWKKMLVG